jgi:hypothetical protein
MIAPLVFRHASQCLTLKHKKGISLTDLIFMTYIQNFSQPPGETSHDYTLCFSTAAAAAPPSASHPRRPRRDGAALGGSERPCRRGRAADLFGGQGGRGRQPRPWPRKGFRVVLGEALARWWKGFVHWQVIFCCIRTCCLRIHFCDGMGLLEFGYKKWQTWWGKGMSEKQKDLRRCRMFNGLKCLVIWILIPV